MSFPSTILAVDDDSDALTWLQHLLTHEGHQVRLADSGELALASLAAGLPELMLIDVLMPNMDGFELCRRLKTTKKYAAIPVIFMSAAMEVDLREKGFALGAVDFVSKPLQ